MNLEKDLVSSKRTFEVEVSEQCADEIIEIYGYIVLYTIDYEKKKVYISRMLYGKRNYLY